MDDGLRVFDQVVKAEQTKERLAVSSLSLWAVVVWPVLVAGVSVGSIGAAVSWAAYGGEMGPHVWAGALLMGGAAALLTVVWRLGVYDRLLVLVDTRREYDQISRPAAVPSERYTNREGEALSWTIWKITSVGASYLARYAEPGKPITRDGVIRAANLEFKARFGTDIIPRYTENWRRGVIQEQFDAAGWVVDRESMIPTDALLELRPTLPLVVGRALNGQTTTTTTVTTAAIGLLLAIDTGLPDWLAVGLMILGMAFVGLIILFVFFRLLVWAISDNGSAQDEPHYGCVYVLEETLKKERLPEDDGFVWPKQPDMIAELKAVEKAKWVVSHE